MPWPVGPISAGVHGENAALHDWVDTVRVGEGATGARAKPMGSLMEQLLGHKSGQGKNANAEYDSGVLFLSPAAAAAGVYTLGGVSSAMAAATLTDALQTWPVNQWSSVSTFGQAFGVFAGNQFNVIASNTATVLTLKSNWSTTPGATTGYFLAALADQNQGGTVTYAAGPANALVDTAKAWAVNQWRGYWVAVVGLSTGTSEVRQIVSNTATQLTLDKAWGNTPTANTAYGILLPTPQGWVEVQHGTGGTTGINQQGGNNNNPLLI